MGGNLDVRLEDGSVATVPGLAQFIQGGFSVAGAAAAAIVFDTGLSPQPGQSFGLLVSTDVNDAVTPASAYNLDAVAFKKSALGVTTISGALANLAKVGTAALIAGAFAVTYSVSVNNTVVVTITPPAAYPNALTAQVQINIVAT